MCFTPPYASAWVFDLMMPLADESMWKGFEYTRDQHVPYKRLCSNILSCSPHFILTTERYSKNRSVKKFTMLRSGFEPESSARKAEMIGRYTIGAVWLVVPGGFEPPSPAPKAGRIDHYPTGLVC